MSNMRDVIQKLVGGDSVSESYAEVIEVLTSLRDNQSDIAVGFAGDNNFYPSIITAVSAKHRVMTIRNSIPASPAALVKDNQVTVKAQKQGRELIFESRFIEPLVADLSLGYQVTIPERIGTEQPRQAFRILLDEIRNRIRITLQGPENQEINGTVRDISQLGVGMKTESELPRFLNQYFFGDQQVVGCNIELDRSREISCKMEIRNVHTLSSDAHATLIGGRITDLNQSDSNLLENFVAQLKREYLVAYA